jgi:hypothetical protein
MKKLILTIALAVAGLGGVVSSAQAHEHENHCGGFYWGGSYCGPSYGGCHDDYDDYDGCNWYFCRRHDHRFEHRH